MNPPLAAIILSFLVPAMGLVLILVGIARLAGLSPTGPRWCAGLVLCSLAIVATPVGGMPLARWLAGIVDHWSLSAMALLVSACFQRLSGTAQLRRKSRQAACLF